ncbi:MAG: hypothetical protein GEU82_05430 [Luteitalea sp.]|nr:hypothetical protein [Luteitalea sp.]
MRTDDRIDRVPRPCREQRRVENYLVARAQQCWYSSPNGRWRITNHELHYDVLVVETEATSITDAEELTRRIVEVHGGASEGFTSFSEILVYVQEEGAPATSTIRRVRWTNRSGTYEVLEFEGALQRR